MFSSSAFFTLPIILFLVVVAPIWIIAHYVTRWRGGKALSSEDEKLLADLWQAADKMESRLLSLERILDAEDTEWRREP